MHNQAKYLRLKEEFEKQCRELVQNPEKFAEYLRFSGRFYKLPPSHTMAIMAANPNSTMVADYDTWQKYHRQVKRGCHGISVATGGKIGYYFDISATSGKSVPYQWSLDKETATKYIEHYNAISGKQSRTFSGCIDRMSDEAVEDIAVKIAKDLDIPRENFYAFKSSFASMIRYNVAARCEWGGSYKYKSNPLDLSALKMIKPERAVMYIEFVQMTSKTVLSQMEKEINVINAERSIENERARRNQTDMVRGGREILSRIQDGERQDVQTPPEMVRIFGGVSTYTRTGGVDERTDRTLGQAVAEVYGGNVSRTGGTDERLRSGLGVDTPQDRQAGAGTVRHNEGGISTENPSSDNVLGNIRMGGNIPNDVDTSRGNGTDISAVGNRGDFDQPELGQIPVLNTKEDNSHKEQKAEVNSPAFSVENLPTITCVWSESRVFDGGKTYSVYEFDRIMKQADDERVAGAKAALEKYGSFDKWYSSDDEDFTKYLGYDKVKFTVNLPNGTSFTERQDIGDGFGGVIDFLSRNYGSVIPLLEQARKATAPKTEIEKPLELPDNTDKFYVNSEDESVTWVHFNPDSDKGGQLVYNHFTFDQLFDNLFKSDVAEALTHVSRTELVDIDEPSFKECAQKFTANNEDFSFSSGEWDRNRLSAVVEPTYTILQLFTPEDAERNGNDILRDYRFTSLADLQKRGLYVDCENYLEVYRGRLKDGETLEDIYAKFNTNRPADFHGHSLSVGDIVTLRQDGKTTANYVDSFGFAEIPDFFLSLDERKALRMSKTNPETKVIDDFKSKTVEMFTPVNGLKANDIEAEVHEYVQNVIDENEINAQIVDLAVVGSRSRGLDENGSDIDIAVEFTSDLKEYALFNLLHEEPYEIGGVRVDINPIRSEETGTLGEYLKQAERTIAENHERKQTVHFGRLGNGITVYDTSKTDTRANDYLTIAHISDEGKIKYYVDTNTINAEDITRIEKQAQQQKEKFTEEWNKLPIEVCYQRILDGSTALTSSRWDIFFADNVGMSAEDMVKKYEHPIIFGDSDFPQATKSLTAYRVGDFYEFYGEDARNAAELLNLMQTRRREVPMTGIPAYAYDKYKRDLAMQGYYMSIGDERNIEKVLSDYAQTVRENTTELQTKQVSENAPAKSIDELQVGDLVRGDGELWKITEISGDYSIHFENTDKSSNLSVQSFFGNWKEQFKKRGYEYANNLKDGATYSTKISEPVLPSDIQALHKITPRKSVLNFTDEEFSSTSAFLKQFNQTLSKKSPYYRAIIGDWRENETTTVPMIDVEDRNATFNSVRDDIKAKVILRGEAVNNDTGWTIQVSRSGLEDTVKYGYKYGDSVIYNALYHIDDIVKNGVLLDTVTSERNKDNKAFNTEFMHKMYGVFRFNGECYLAKLTVEEFPDAKLQPLRRLYNLQDIKIEPLRHIGFEKNSLSRSILNGSTVSIAQLFQIVKTFDKDFYINHRISEQKRDLSEQELISESKSEKEQTVQDVEKSKDAQLKLKDIVITLTPRSESEVQRTEIPAETAEKHDFTITDEHLGEGGQKSKYAANIAAIKVLKAVESENRLATPAEQETLSKYVGWGGIPQAFDENNQQWKNEYIELKKLLTDEEYTSARASTPNAHYTSPEVIKAIYKGLENLGFEGGNVLEPAMGVGNFFGVMPEKIRTNSTLKGIELDSISGRIAQQLYQSADIQIRGFEKTDFSDNYFDAAIGNVPFGNYGIADKRYDKEHFLIHDYFFAKTLDKVAPNGIIAFVTSKGTLDKANPSAREYIAKRADLIGAIRLPNNAFKGNANTKVTTDIIFLQKREKMAVEMPDWCYTSKNSEGIPVNSYFLDHPEMILGKMEFSEKMYGNTNDTTCTPIEGAVLSEQLEKAVSRLHAEHIVHKREERNEKERGVIPATDDVRNYTYGLVGGEMYYRENNIMTKVRETGTKLERMKGMHELRNTMRTLITAQYEGCNDEQLAAIQSELNRKYDDFVKQFGSINSSPNRTVFCDDDDYNTLSALENVNPETKAVEKSDIFYKRTIKPNVEITKAENEQEAMQISLDLKGRLDIPYMAELCGKSAEEICNQLTLQELAYVNPEKYNPDKPYEGYEDAAEYLSGNIREKLRTAQTAAKNDEMFARNVAALEKALPPTITAGEITARIGVPWVDTSDYTQFLREYAKANISESIIRTYSGEYKVPKTYDCSIAATSTYGTKRMRSYDIFENLLNNRNCIVHDRIRDEKGNEKYVVNRKETELVSAKAREMKDAFKRWLWEEPARREKYVTRYNELFNSIVGREYDGSHQSFPQMSPSIKLNPHQKNAVMRTKFGGNTLLAHCVGAGKSFEMVAATMEKKRLGLINKACVVVPKHLVGQMAAEWMRLYPQAHILTATEKDFTKDKRQKFIGRCCTGNYDAVIMSYQQFEKIPMSTEYRARFLQNELTKVEFGLKETRASNGSPISIKDFEKQKKRIQAIIEKLLNAKEKDNSLCFEELGFDALVVDEAHNYKNGLVVTKMSNVAGVQSTPAQKSEDILMKTQWLNENHNGNIIFATGTPVSNSMVELYTMQQYLRPDLLHNAGLQNFDDWSSTFGEVVSQLEMKPTGDGYRTKNRFARFTNLPELMAMYKEFADIRTAEMLKLPVPEIVGGKPQTIKAEPNEFQKAYMQVLSNRADAIQNKLVEPTEDNMLKITNEARLLGLDARCINPDAENTPNSKVNLCIDKIMEIYNKTTEQKGVQAVFCDIAINADDGKFSVYDYIKEELQRRGIPKEEICTAADAKDQKQREEMYAELRSGTKRIVIASTSKMGTGANIQTRLAALHHLDIPWKPSDLEQRNGRILRQGNTFKQVEIYNYVTEGTFDAYLMNIIVNKQKFISQLMSGKTPARTCEDVDEAVLNYSEIQAIASGDTRIKEKIELDNEVSRLRLLESEYYNKKYELEDSAAKLPAIIERKKASLENAKSDKAFAETNKLPENTFAITIDGTKYTERKDAGAALSRELVSAVAKKEYKEIGEYCGFKVSFTFSGLSIPYISLKKDSLSYTTTPDLGNDLGNIVRLENVLKLGIDKTIKSLEESIARDERDLNEALATKDAPFEYAEELAKKSARLEQLNNELDVGKAEEIALNDDNDEQKIDRKPPKHNL